MKNIYPLTALVLLFFCACRDNKTSVASIIDASGSSDEKEIIALVKKMYCWQESISFKGDLLFFTKAGDSVYTGVDMMKEKKQLNILSNTGIFSEGFVANHYRIATTIDSMLRIGAFGEPWRVGDLSPFSNDTGPWCNCQDVPVDTAWWNEMKFGFIDIDRTKATLRWTWIDTIFDKSKSEYTIKLVKTDGKWKIDYLQGFDYEAFTGVK